MPTLPRLLAEDAPRPWDDIPAVALVGIVIGLLLLAAAIRSMCGRRDK